MAARPRVGAIQRDWTLLLLTGGRRAIRTDIRTGGNDQMGTFLFSCRQPGSGGAFGVTDLVGRLSFAINPDDSEHSHYCAVKGLFRAPKHFWLGMCIKKGKITSNTFAIMPDDKSINVRILILEK